MTVTPVQVGIGMGSVSHPRQLGWLLVYADAEAQTAQVRRLLRPLRVRLLAPADASCYHSMWRRSVSRSFRKPARSATQRRFALHTRTVSDSKALEELLLGRNTFLPQTLTRCAHASSTCLFLDHDVHPILTFESLASYRMAPRG